MVRHRPLFSAASALLVLLPVAACGAAPASGYERHQLANFTMDLPADWYEDGDLGIEWSTSDQGLETGIMRAPEGEMVIHTIWALSNSEKSALEWTEEKEGGTAEAAGSYERVSLEGRESTNWFGPDRSTALLEFEAVLDEGDYWWIHVDVEDPHRLVLQKVVKREDTDMAFGIRVSLPVAEAQEHRETAEAIVDSFDMHIYDDSDV
ncbi:hypothetical protein [Nocardiopsis sp. CC223A]|uniref:hypothetical protein n=1 Tax=Nocardiopsis sp. CC223A TaxID=3044051 RepID=UPI00278BBD10|nr:hypothetical protein [Nocardiopsis sp. CC223A]